jgi:hypothetical protein
MICEENFSVAHERLLFPAGGRTKPSPRRRCDARCGGHKQTCRPTRQHECSRGRAAQLVRVSRRPAASREKETEPT